MPVCNALRWSSVRGSFPATRPIAAAFALDALAVGTIPAGQTKMKRKTLSGWQPNCTRRAYHLDTGNRRFERA